MNMRLDRSNYEIWLVDYLDGNLSDERTRELFSFLAENPDISEEFSDLLNYRIQPAIEEFMDKEWLKKTAADLSGYQFEMLCVASLENDLDKTRLKEFNEILALSEDKRKTAAIISRTKLTPPSIRFRYKAKLRKLTMQQKALRVSAAAISIAAAVLLLFTIIRNPLTPLPGNDTVISQAGNIDKPETVISDKPAVNEIKQQQTIAVNFGILASKQPAKIISETKSGEVKIPSAEDLTDFVESPGPAIKISIDKLEFNTNISIPGIKAGTDLVAINLVAVEPVPYDERPGLNESIAKFFREKILKTETPESGSLKAYEVADAGINGLNRLLGWNMKLEKYKDEKGEVNSVYFSSRILKFNAPVKKSEPAE
jgi:hypothetical protein